ncbi:MAG: class I SAM-dependent methyltransferase [Sedimentisphaerales bacterium]|nr:class I SAM-dependent methyltransferase [Sedimentisphaerales bacterium]
MSSKKASAWWVIPGVLRHWNELITGDPEIDYCDYIADKYLSGSAGLRGLSLGCGDGNKVLNWLRLCDFQKITAYDITPSRIEFAKKKAEEKGCADKLEYMVQDINKIDYPSDFYDFVFIEQSLHHFSPLKDLLLKINDTLHSGGYFVINEYVGPDRFQWTQAQLDLANAVLRMLPEKYRVRQVDGAVQKKIYRPGRLQMILRDPSEAVESSNIMPLLHEVFDVVEERPYNGAILHLLFNGIARNFCNDDEDSRRILRLCIEIEDVMTEIGQVQSDYAVVICRKK